MTLLEYETKRDSLIQLPDPHEAALNLRLLSREIRRMVWAPPYRLWAKTVADTADQAAAVIEHRYKLTPTGQLPRYEGGYAGNSYYGPIY